MGIPHSVSFGQKSFRMKSGESALISPIRENMRQQLFAARQNVHDSVVSLHELAESSVAPEEVTHTNYSLLLNIESVDIVAVFMHK